jgi:hypothetical protein
LRGCANSHCTLPGQPWLIKMQKFYPIISLEKKKDFNTILIDLFGQLKMICSQNELWVLDLEGNLRFAQY